MAQLKQKSGAEIHAVYEACGFGFGLQRQLTALGIACYVVCPQKLGERNKRVKTDGLDAKALCLKLDRFVEGNAMTSLRASHTATLLTNGELLIAGGHNGSTANNTAELFDPQSGTFMGLPLMNSARWLHAATLLESGKVLLTGGAGALHVEDLFDPGGIAISGTISYCLNPIPGPVPNVTVSLTGSGLSSTQSSGSGTYTFAGLVSGSTYTVTPTKAARLPGSAGIDTVDVVATQRQFLVIGTPLTGFRLTAADVNGDTLINTIDVVAIQRFFLGVTTGIANVGKYQFNPMSRSYSAIVTDQTNQNYDTLVFGDVASPFVEP